MIPLTSMNVLLLIYLPIHKTWSKLQSIIITKPPGHRLKRCILSSLLIKFFTEAAY
jgi:hypothetical protein